MNKINVLMMIGEIIKTKCSGPGFKFRRRIEEVGSSKGCVG